MHRIASLLLCLSTLTCAKTGEQNEIETVVVVTVSRVTSDLRILRASATLSGSAAMKIEDFVASPPAQ